MQKNATQKLLVVLSSEVSSFNIKSDCIFCAKYIDTGSECKLNKGRRDTSHNVETIEVLHSIKEIALGRDDNWGHEVLLGFKTLVI